MGNFDSVFACHTTVNWWEISLIIRSIVEKLGTDRVSKIKIIGDDEVKQSFYGQLVLGKGVSSSLDEQLAKAVNKAGMKLFPLHIISLYVV